MLLGCASTGIKRDPAPFIALKACDQGEVLGRGIRDGIIRNLASLLVTRVISYSESLAFEELLRESWPEASD